MHQTMPNICVATLGGQPQVVTLALDRLLAEGTTFDEVIVVHLATDNPRYQQALQRLNAEFAGDQYAGRPCHFRPHPIRLHAQTIADLSSELAVDAVQQTLRTLFMQLKQQEVMIHLCLSGGRRLLGMVALTTAMLCFDETDRIWHLFSADPVREQSDGGAIMHLPPTPDVKLLRIHAPVWGRYVPPVPLLVETSTATILEQQRETLDVGERARCQQVWDNLTPRRREVLKAFAANNTPQEVADMLHIELGTVNDHKTAILHECRIAWDHPPDERLDYHWLREHFALFFSA